MFDAVHPATGSIFHAALQAAGAGLAVMDPFTATARANSGLIVRPLKQRIPLQYGILTLRERALVGECAALVDTIQQEVRKSLTTMVLER